MFELIELIYEFQFLRCKSQALGIPLSDNERGRLLGLGRMLDADSQPHPFGRAYVRVSVENPIQFTAPAGFGLGQVCDIGGGGMCIATSRPLPSDFRTVVRLVDPIGGREYVFPCRVVWRRTGRDACMGVEFDGIPLRLAFGVPRSGEWRRSLLVGAEDPAPSRA